MLHLPSDCPYNCIAYTGSLSQNTNVCKQLFKEFPAFIRKDFSTALSLPYNVALGLLAVGSFIGELIANENLSKFWICFQNTAGATKNAQSEDESIPAASSPEMAALISLSARLVVEDPTDVSNPLNNDANATSNFFAIV